MKISAAIFVKSKSFQNWLFTAAFSRQDQLVCSYFDRCKNISIPSLMW